MTMVVVMMVLDCVEVTKNLMLRVTVVIMLDLDRMEVILMTTVVVMMVLDRVKVTKNLMWMVTGVIMTDLDLVEVILMMMVVIMMKLDQVEVTMNLISMMMVVIMMVVAEIAMIITMKDLDRWHLQIVHCEITLHLSISQGAFRRIDRNRDGFITWEEFQRVCIRFN